MATYFS